MLELRLEITLFQLLEVLLETLMIVVLTTLIQLDLRQEQPTLFLIG